MKITISKEKIQTILIKVLKTKKFKFFAFIFLVYHSIFNTFTGNLLLKSVLESQLQAPASGSFSKFSLFYGFILDDIEIRANKEFSEEIVFSCKKLSLEYNLPALAVFHLKLTEISLTDPYVYIHQKEKKWNFETIANPGEKKDVEEKIDESPSESQSEINLYIPVSAYIKFFIKNLTTKILIEDAQTLEAGIDKFNINFQVKTDRFSKIPLSTQAASILEIFELTINPENSPRYIFNDGSTRLDSEMTTRFILQYDNTLKPPIFRSDMNVGNENLNLSFNNQSVENFGFNLGYALKFIPDKDSLELSNFIFSIIGNKWLEVEGRVERVTNSEREINLSVRESRIVFDSLNRVLSKFPGITDTRIYGNLSLEGIGLVGKMSDASFIVKVQGDSIRAITGGSTHSVNKLEINLDGILDLATNTKPSEENLLPNVKVLNINNLYVNYNGIDINLTGVMKPKTLVDFLLTVDKIYLENFINKLKGSSNVKVEIKGSKLSYLNIDVFINLLKLRYFMGSSISGLNDIELIAHTEIDLGNGFAFEKLILEKLSFILKNDNKEVGANFKTNLTLILKPVLDVQIPNFQLDLNLTRLIPTLPLSLRNTIGNLRESLGNNLVLGGFIEFIDGKKNQVLKTELRAGLPALELKDLKITSNISISKEDNSEVLISNLGLSGYDNKLRAAYSGKFFKPFTPNPPFGEFTGELKGNFTLESPQYRYITKGIYFQGDIDFDLDLKGNIIRGKLSSEDSNFKIKQNCPGDTCTETDISGIKMNIPFLHDLYDKTTEDLVEGNAEPFVQNYGMTKKSNFIINRITSNHPVEKDKRFDFIKPTENLPGISVFIEYKENFLNLDNLKINTLGGVIFGKDFIVNIGNGDPAKIQYSAILQIRDIDLKQIIPSTNKKKIDDGKIKGDLNIKGENLTDPIGNLDLFFSIFQIGEDFGKSAVNIVSPTNFVTDRIINSYTVNKIEVEINHGLVYARVLFNKSIMNSLLFQVENDRIQQERIPLANFLKRAESELTEYK